MYIVYGIEEDGSEGEVCECKTLAEAAEQLEEWLMHRALDREPPEPGDPDPATLPPCYGIKFNEHHAWSLISALTVPRETSAR